MYLRNHAENLEKVEESQSFINFPKGQRLSPSSKAIEIFSDHRVALGAYTNNRAAWRWNGGYGKQTQRGYWKFVRKRPKVFERIPHSTEATNAVQRLGLRLGQVGVAMEILLLESRLSSTSKSFSQLLSILTKAEADVLLQRGCFHHFSPFGLRDTAPSLSRIARLETYSGNLQTRLTQTWGQRFGCFQSGLTVWELVAGGSRHDFTQEECLLEAFKCLDIILVLCGLHSEVLP